MTMIENRNYDEIKAHIKNIIKVKVTEEKVCSQVKLAEITGVHKTSVFAWIYETACPDAARIPLIAKALNISISELLGTENDAIELQKALWLYEAYEKHPDVQNAIKKLLEL